MKLILSYLAACAAGCVAINVIQLLLVLIGVTNSHTLTFSVFSQNAVVVCFLFLLALVIELPGKRFGLQRWQPLALLCIVAPVPIILVNITKLSIAQSGYILASSLALCATMAALYFLSTWIGERAFSRLQNI